MSKSNFLYLSESVQMRVINAFDKAIQHQNEITEELKNYPEEIIEYSKPGYSPIGDFKHPCHGICTTLARLLIMDNPHESELEELIKFMHTLTDEISSRLGSENLYLQHWLVSQGYPATKHDLKLKVNAVKLSETRAAWLKSLKEEFCHEHES